MLITGIHCDFGLLLSDPIGDGIAIGIGIGIAIGIEGIDPHPDSNSPEKRNLYPCAVYVFTD